MSGKNVLSPVVIFTILLVSLLAAPAQAEVDFGLRAGLYTDTSEPFVGIEVLAPVGRPGWFWNPNFEYVFVDNGDLYTLNLDAHYDFWQEGSLTVWGGGGAALVFRDFGPDDETDFGLNLLAGVGTIRGSLRPYAQGKILLSDESEFVLSAGIRF